MKSTIFPIVLGFIIGAFCASRWFFHELPVSKSVRGNIFFSMKGAATKTEASYRPAQAMPGTIADPDVESLGSYPNLRRLQLLDELKQNKNLNVSIPIVNGNGRLSSNFKELFDLTDEQVLEIEDNILMLRAKMITDMIVPSCVVKEDHKTSVEIPPNENIVEYYDKFMDMMQNYLGSERFPAFLHFSNKQFNSLFNGFGSERLSIVFEYSGNKITDGKILVTEERTTKAGPIRKTYECSNAEMAFGQFPGLEKILIE